MSKRFVGDECGTLAVTFALALLPLAALAGGAMDYSRAVSARASLQAIVDAASVTAVGKKTSPERVEHARSHVVGSAPSLPHRASLTGVEVSETLVGALKAPRVSIEAKGVVPTPFMGLIGLDGIKISAQADASVSSKTVEIALVVDVTGSMKGTRITALRDSAKAFVNTLLADGVDTANVRISIVPYSASVNIGRARVHWLTPRNGVPGGSRFDNRYIWTEVKQADCAGTDVKWNAALQACHIGQLSVWDEKGGPCPGIKDKGVCYVSDGWTGCVEERGRGDDDMTDATPSQTSFRPYYWPSWGGVAGATPNDKYNSYLPRSVDESKKTNATSNDGRGPNLGCPQNAIVSWTNDKDVLLTQIGQFEAWHRGGTMGHVGLVWGWRMISPQWRGSWDSADLPRDYDSSTTEKIVVFMTDGENGFYSGHAPSGDSDYTAYGRVSEVANVTTSNAQAFLDKKMITVCESMKGLGIELFTVGLNLSSNAAGTQAKKLLSQCASSSKHYFDSGTTTLVAHFKKIATDISSRRIQIAR